MSIGHQMMLLEKYTKQWIRRAFAPLGVSPTEGMIIIQLAFSSNPEAAESESSGQMATHDALAKGLHLDKGLTSRTLKSLEEKGLVIRTDNPQDARSIHFELTPKAAKLAPRLLAAMEQWNQAVFGDLSESEVASIAQTVEDLLARVMKANQ